MKHCYVCQVDKPTTEFHRSRCAHDGLQGKCKACAGLFSKRHGPSRDWRHIHLRRRYKLSLLEYEEMARAQGGKCAICGTVTELCVDHCKITKRVRGLLCQNCNRGIGIFYHDSASLRRALDYLERTDAVCTRPSD